MHDLKSQENYAKLARTGRKPRTKLRQPLGDKTMSAQPDNLFGTAANDADAQETREWIDALSAVIQAEGRERGHFLLEQLLEQARQQGIDMPFSANTGYVNTIEPDDEERCPGNLDVEERLRAYMRWNAMAMVVK